MYDQIGLSDIFYNENPDGKNIPTPSVNLVISKGHIEDKVVDIIVNAAHENLTGGGGVDGAIHNKAGSSLLGECLNLYGCPEGEARITGGYNLPAKYILHTVGPVWKSGNIEAQEKAKKTLTNCYKNCLTFAEMQGVKSIAFPCISTGAYCFPKSLAAVIALLSINEWVEDHIRWNGEYLGFYLQHIEIVCFTDEDVKIYQEAIKIVDNFCSGININQILE